MLLRKLTGVVFLFVNIMFCYGSEIDGKKFIDPNLPDCGIQKAIDSLGQEGGTVVLPEGRFILSRTILLRNNVILKGQGEKTILTHKLNNRWLKVVSVNEEEKTITLEEIPEDLKIGSSIFIWPGKPVTGWLGYYEPQIITSISENTIKIDGVMARLKGAKFISYGHFSTLVQDCRKGDDRLLVSETSIFVPGGAIVVGSGDSNANESLSFIKEIRDRTLILERPIRMDHLTTDQGFWKRPLVWTIFPLITAEGAKNIGIKNLVLESAFPPDERPKLRRYTCSPIHLYNVENGVVENVIVRNSFADGISVQGGKNIVVRNCEVYGSSGNGFHPGTGLNNSVFENNLSHHNGGDGIYFCWHNRFVKILNNKIWENSGAGIGGLGNPGDIENLIEGNLIEKNSGPGIGINGGKTSKNIIRKNIIRDNSKGNPGKFPGILIHAAVEDAKAYLIEENIIESTEPEPCQHVGIEERNGKYKDTITLADENTIKNNKFKGHKIADIVVSGSKTVVENPDAKITKKEEPETK